MKLPWYWLPKGKLPFFLLLIQFIVRCQWVITNHFLRNLFLILRLLCSCSQRNMHIMNTYFEDFHKLKELIIIWIKKENSVSCPAAPLSSLPVTILCFRALRTTPTRQDWFYQWMLPYVWVLWLSISFIRVSISLISMLYSTLLCGSHTIYLPILLLVGIWVVSVWKLLKLCLVIES